MALLTQDQRRTTRRRGATILLVALLWLVPPLLAPAQSTPVVEHRVKAAFLFNFAKFVEWPTERAELCIGVLGDEPFGRALEASLRGKSVRGRAIVVDRSRRPEEITDCEIVFVAARSSERYEEILQYLATRPILTVGDELAFAESGGVATFFIERGKVRFAMNPAAIDRAGLKVSAQLLGLARIVEDDEE